MWSTFSVCSTCVSVIIMSMTSCNTRMASSGASSSTVRFHLLGVLSNEITLPVSISYANARSSPKHTRCPCCVMGLTTIRGFRTSGCRDSKVIGLLSRSWVTSKRRPSSHATDWPAVAHGTPASASQRHLYPRVARCRAGSTVQHAADRILTARPTDSVLSPVNLLRTLVLANVCSKCCDHPTIRSETSSQFCDNFLSPSFVSRRFTRTFCTQFLFHSSQVSRQFWWWIHQFVPNRVSIFLSSTINRKVAHRQPT